MDPVQVPSDQRLIGLAGDWHGATRWATAAVKSFRAAGVQTIFQVGDFGYWPNASGAAFVRRVNDACEESNVMIFVTPGNHEDWNALDRSFALGKGPHPIAPRIFALPRGWRWSILGRRFVSLGGAPSIDFESRIRGKDWWPTEAITDADVDRIVNDGPADVMLAHDSPDQGTAAVRFIAAQNPLGVSATARAYARDGRAKMTRAFSAVRPRLFVHGHYHVYDEIMQPENRATNVWRHRILSLDKETGRGNAAVLDVGNLRSTLLRVPK